MIGESSSLQIRKVEALTKAITFVMTLVDTEPIFKEYQILTLLKNLMYLGVSLIVGIVFHRVIAFDDPHAYVAAIKLTCESKSGESRSTSHRTEPQFTLKPSIMNDASEDTGTCRDSHSH
jgi:hypothetical protein